MAQNSSIEWTETTWNPLTGCTKISPGCKHCYAERMSHRLEAMGQPNYANGFKLTLHERMLEVPLRWKKPRVVFFQVLTKRSDRLLKLSPKIEWPANVWMGVSVERDDYIFRIDHLRQTEAKVRFLSLEPLLGPLERLNLDRIDWVIAGGESGPGARPMEEAWVTDIRDQCLDAEVPFFFKQWGGVFKKRHGRTLEGQTWDEMPMQDATERERRTPLLVI